VDDEAISALVALAEQAEAAAERWTPDLDGEISHQYSVLRNRALLLAERHGWAGGPQLTNEFPSVRHLALIGELNRQWALATGVSTAAPSECESSLQRALRGLAAWAIGVRLAGELRL
jgi:hypothetical protein